MWIKASSESLVWENRRLSTESWIHQEHSRSQSLYKDCTKSSSYLSLILDDLFLTGEENLIAQTKRELSAEFEMKDVGLMHYFLGLEVWQKLGEIFFSHSKYAVDVLRRFCMMDCKSMTTPMISNLKKLQDQVTGSDPEDPTLYRQIIGSLTYLIHTRPDICYAVNALSLFMCEPKHIHMVAVKHILRYVRGTISFDLRYTSSGGVMLH